MTAVLWAVLGFFNGIGRARVTLSDSASTLGADWEVSGTGITSTGAGQAVLKSPAGLRGDPSARLLGVLVGHSLKAGDSAAVVEDIARERGVDTVVMIPDEFLARNQPARLLFASTKGGRSIYDSHFQAGDYLVFGNETSGLSNEELAMCPLPISIRIRVLEMTSPASCASATACTLKP